MNGPHHTIAALDVLAVIAFIACLWASVVFVKQLRRPAAAAGIPLLEPSDSGDYSAEVLQAWPAAGAGTPLPPARRAIGR
jgi:hypothetical protein